MKKIGWKQFNKWDNTYLSDIMSIMARLLKRVIVLKIKRMFIYL